jgi:hypothetical protein
MNIRATRRWDHDGSRVPIRRNTCEESKMKFKYLTCPRVPTSTTPFGSSLPAADQKIGFAFDLIASLTPNMQKFHTL